MPIPSKNIIRKELLGWFRENKRELPWRDVKDPYKIWLSEVLMQQTRVTQGLPYYLRFVEKFPTVRELASASEQEVLKLWQGLGYYSRARNLHLTAKIIVEKFNGIFPDNYEDIISLKGVGSYTASAILSIAFDKPFAVLDGNVYRVLSRLYAIELPVNAAGAEKVYSGFANDLLDKQNPGEFNEAMMELGAIICTPTSPKCENCPLNNECEAFRLGKVNELPIKIKAKKAINRDLDYLFIHNSEGLYLKKRQAGDIWQGLYDMPEAGEILDTKNEKNLLKRQKHLLSHQTLNISFYDSFLLQNGSFKSAIGNRQSAMVQFASEPLPSYKNNTDPEIAPIFVPFNKLNEYPLPRPIEIFLKEYLENNEIC